MKRSSQLSFCEAVEKKSFLETDRKELVRQAVQAALDFNSIHVSKSNFSNLVTLFYSCLRNNRNIFDCQTCYKWDTSNRLDNPVFSRGLSMCKSCKDYVLSKMKSATRDDFERFSIHLESSLALFFKDKEDLNCSDTILLVFKRVQKEEDFKQYLIGMSVSEAVCRMSKLCEGLEERARVWEMTDSQISSAFEDMKLLLSSFQNKIMESRRPK